MESVFEIAYVPLPEGVNGTVGTPISSPSAIEQQAMTAQKMTFMVTMISRINWFDGMRRRKHEVQLVKTTCKLAK